MSTSLCTERQEPLSESVTKVQKLPNISAWNDQNALLRDYVWIFFTKRSAVFRMKQNLPSRKRVLILTPDDILLIYETNCTGYSFDVTKAIRMKTSHYRQEKNKLEKVCAITFKYKFGYVNLALVTDGMKNQIPIWRKTLSAIYEDECFNGNLLNDLSTYTARDEDIDQDLISNRSEYTPSVISLKSTRGSINRTLSEDDVTVDSTQIENDSLKTNSNRSSTCLPSRSNVSTASNTSTCRNKIPHETIVENKNKQSIISIRQGSHAVSYLTRKFEAKFGSGKSAKPRPSSSPLEILFPSHPVNQQTQPEEDVFEIPKEENPRRMSMISSLFSKWDTKDPNDNNIQTV